MNGTYDVVQEQFKNTCERENKPVKVVTTGEEYNVVFRRNRNTNTTKNHATIFYPKEYEGMKQGRLLLFRNKFFLLMNQEEIENDVYFRSDIVQCNCVLNTLVNKTSQSGTWYADEIVVNAFSSDMKSNATIDGNVISVLGGKFDLMAEDNVQTRLIQPSDLFSEFGGTFRVDGIYFLEGFARIALERGMDNLFSMQPLLLINPVQLMEGYEYDLLDVVSPVMRYFNVSGNTATDYVIRNSTIEIISSDLSIADYNPETNKIETYSSGSVTFTVKWIEHGISVSETLEVEGYEAPQPYAIITYSGVPEIKQSGSAKTFTVTVFDGYDNDITSQVAANWIITCTNATTVVANQSTSASPNGNRVHWYTNASNTVSLRAGTSAVIGSFVGVTFYADDVNYGHIETNLRVEIVPLW